MTDNQANKSLFLENFKYLIVGTIFGVIFVKAQIISWYRIQEMFLFKSFYMYGVIGSAVFVGLISIQILKKLGIKTMQNQPISIEPKTYHKGQIIGGLIFGIGWAITGACPGPLYAIVGNGNSVVIVTILSAVLGTWIYGKFKEKLPH